MWDELAREGIIAPSRFAMSVVHLRLNEDQKSYVHWSELCHRAQRCISYAP